MTKIALIGFGKMGQQIAQLSASNPNISITAIIDTAHPDATCPNITADSLGNCDIAIDFTHPTCAISNLEKVASFGKNMVMGTTGWYSDMDKAKEIVEKSGIGFIFASNFSIGVNIFWRIIEKSAQLGSKFSEYDVFGHEYHHNKKADSPSGTAKTTAEIILKNFPSKTTILYDTSREKIEPSALHFTSTRGGSVPGTHSVFFDSEADTIEITHTARSRAGFASGALKSAEWLVGKKGFFNVEDYLNSIL